MRRGEGVPRFDVGLWDGPSERFEKKKNMENFDRPHEHGSKKKNHGRDHQQKKNRRWTLRHPSRGFLPRVALASKMASDAPSNASTYNLKNPAVKRILQEVKELQENRGKEYWAEPLEVSLLVPSLDGRIERHIKECS